MMTRKHFVAIAEIISKNNLGFNSNLTINLCDFFSKENPNFDEKKFLEACQK